MRLHYFLMGLIVATVLTNAVWVYQLHTTFNEPSWRVTGLFNTVKNSFIERGLRNED